MRRTLGSIGAEMLRGYGQLFLAENAASGALFLAGLTVLSPIDACFSLLGCLFVPFWARCAGHASETRTGLYGVNGALLGYSWILFPDIPFAAKLPLTVLGSLTIAFLLISSTRLFRRLGSNVALFALPYVVAVWLNLLIAHAAGWHDPGLYRSWHALAFRTPEEARRLFEAASPSTQRGEAARQIGLGWSAFRLADFASAGVHFEQAIRLGAERSDAFTGAGWCAFRQGRYDAAEARFREAIRRNWNDASAQDGLGWILLGQGAYAEAARHFEAVLWGAPLLADAHRGKAECALRTAQSRSAQCHLACASTVDAWLSPASQYVSTPQLVCWLLSLLGILWNSRRSAGAAAVGLLASFAVARLFPATRATLANAALAFNLLPLFLAFGGQYLRLSIGTLAWTAATATFLAATWDPVSSALAAWGLPTLCLPFNLALTGTTILLARFAWGKRMLIPLEIAAMSPENASLWRAKADTAAECWRRLERRD